MKPLTGNFTQRGTWWFRFFGFGIRVKRLDLYPRLFSERELGHGRAIFGRHIRFLRPEGI